MIPHTHTSIVPGCFRCDLNLDEVEPECSRSYEDSPCGGDLFTRTSRSGLTTSTICEKHAAELEERLDEIERRYPEVNHPDGCGCWGCSEGSW